MLSDGIAIGSELFINRKDTPHKVVKLIKKMHVNRLDYILIFIP